MVGWMVGDQNTPMKGSRLPLFRSFLHPLFLSLLLPFNVPGLSSQLSRRWAVELIWGCYFSSPPPPSPFVYVRCARAFRCLGDAGATHEHTHKPTTAGRKHNERGQEEGMDGGRERETERKGGWLIHNNMALSCPVSCVLCPVSVDTRHGQVMYFSLQGTTYSIASLLQTGDFLGREGGCRDGFDSMVEFAAKNETDNKPADKREG
ncbi:MAG: hypothetical protein BYD32DRAFT_118785 [Podila humilis]|nr:MAG: hypothetical protein BYD32DRAFT_118785 [Podila humilis]